jgi:hypothetical protein
MVATTPADLGMDINQKTGDGNGDANGAMMDLTGIVFSVSINTHSHVLLN